ncbi:unnamed protein product, partial [Ilex paraguariensis]
TFLGFSELHPSFRVYTTTISLSSVFTKFHGVFPSESTLYTEYPATSPSWELGMIELNVDISVCILHEVTALALVVFSPVIPGALYHCSDQ